MTEILISAATMPHIREDRVIVTEHTREILIGAGWTEPECSRSRTGRHILLGDGCCDLCKQMIAPPRFRAETEHP